MLLCRKMENKPGKEALFVGGVCIPWHREKTRHEKEKLWQWFRSFGQELQSHMHPVPVGSCTHSSPVQLCVRPYIIMWLYNDITQSDNVLLPCILRPSAVVWIQAFGLTPGYCLLLEAEHDPRQLQSLRSVSLSLQRSVRNRNIHIATAYSNKRDIWNSQSPSRCNESMCKEHFGWQVSEFMWNVAVSICKQDDCSCSLVSWGILTSLLFLLWKCVPLCECRGVLVCFVFFL